MNVNWPWNRCHRERQAICLWISGCLPAEERQRVQAHLGSCPACRKYSEQMVGIGTELRRFRDAHPEARPSAQAQARWERAMRTASESTRAQFGEAETEDGRQTQSSHEMVGRRCGGAVTGRCRSTALPGRLSRALGLLRFCYRQRALCASLGAVWCLILFFRLTAPEVPKTARIETPPPGKILAVLKHLRPKAQLISLAIEPPDLLAPVPSLDRQPGPRSEHRPSTSDSTGRGREHILCQYRSEPPRPAPISSAEFIPLHHTSSGYRPAVASIRVLVQVKRTEVRAPFGCGLAALYCIARPEGCPV